MFSAVASSHFGFRSILLQVLQAFWRGNLMLYNKQNIVNTAIVFIMESPRATYVSISVSDVSETS